MNKLNTIDEAVDTFYNVVRIGIAKHFNITVDEINKYQSLYNKEPDVIKNFSEIKPNMTVLDRYFTGLESYIFKNKRGEVL
jgi:hypothetical protein